MRTPAIVTVALLCGCAPSRAELLREQYRRSALDPATVEECRRDPSRCPGYGRTFWGMPFPDVVRETGCLDTERGCVLPRAQGLEERYLFSHGELASVLIDFDGFDAGLTLLTAQLGQPGWRGDNSGVLDPSLEEAKQRELAANVLAGFALLPLGTGSYPLAALLMAREARDDLQRLERRKATMVPMQCASWSRSVTRVVLCEVKGHGTTALFKSRIDPDTTQLGDWHGRP